MTVTDDAAGQRRDTDGPEGELSRARAAYAQAIAAFGDVTAALSDISDRDELLHLIAEKICDLIGVQRCSLYLREERSRLYRGQVGHWRHDIDDGVKRLTSGGPGDAFTREIVATKAPVVIPDVLNDPRPLRSTMRSWDVRSMMGVPMVLQGDVVGIVYLDDHDRPRRYTDADQSIASAFADLAAIAIQQAKLGSEMRERLDTVARQNATMRRATVVEERLTALVLDGRNMREIAAEIAELTGKPCAIHDERFRAVAVGRPRAIQDQSVRPRLLEPDVRDHPDVRRALAGLPTARPVVVGPFPLAGVHQRALVAPVATTEALWGYLVLLEHGSRLTNLDMVVGRRAATIIAWEMSAERRAVAAEWNARSSLVGELLRGNQDVKALERRAEHVGVALERPHVLCLVTSALGSTTSVPEARAVAEAITGGDEELAALATGVTEGVALVLPLEGDDPIAAVAGLKRRVAEGLARLDDAGALLAGISTPCRSVPEYVDGYAQVAQVVQCLQTFSSGGRNTVLTATDLGGGRLFLSSANAQEAARFVDETLGPILADRAREEVLATLDIYFHHDRSVRLAAQSLGVHENTIRYRLSRIEELTRMAVTTEAEAQFNVQLALLVLRLQGHLPWHLGDDD
ncbi:GAF domain-containing protein [Patulibacter brassicae]|uniref:GAF domain-containing protein n=1 Tax=Patulibacter brassicae TaxID=1705717 RepID=A0ABU4VLN6_9ACTN|nr:GAF domain-containing protein [Patulibacter brassicae]MDX8152693.1 GAF domain-containing protein [Patulibacter brassicae]